VLQLNCPKAIINGPTLPLLCNLTCSPHIPLAQNALWALKNLSFHAVDTLKTQIITSLTYPKIQRLLSRDTGLVLRIQAMELVQNVLADCGSGELVRYFEGLGEGGFLDLLGGYLDEGEGDELRIPVSFISIM
jgi:hypothetical protein